MQAQSVNWCLGSWYVAESSDEFTDGHYLFRDCDFPDQGHGLDLDQGHHAMPTCDHQVLRGNVPQTKNAVQDDAFTGANTCFLQLLETDLWQVAIFRTTIAKLILLVEDHPGESPDFADFSDNCLQGFLCDSHQSDFVGEQDAKYLRIAIQESYLFNDSILRRQYLFEEDSCTDWRLAVDVYDHQFLAALGKMHLNLSELPTETM